MKNKFTLRCLYLIFVLGVVTGTGLAQSTFTNPITGTNPNTSNPYTTGEIYEPYITVSGIGRGTGIVGSNANDRYNANGWNSATPDVNDFFEFTITPQAGFNINFLNFVYTGQVSGTGPTSFAFRSSLDAFTADIGIPTAAGTTIDLSSAAYQGITATITFRLYAWGASSGVGTFSINDFTFNRQPQYFKSNVLTGDWNSGSTWTSSLDNTTFSNQQLIPSNDDKKIIINSGNVVNLTTPDYLDETIIYGTLQVLTGGVLNVSDGLGNDIDIQDGGILQIVSTVNPGYSNVFLGSTSQTVIETGGKIEIGDGVAVLGSGYEAFATTVTPSNLFTWSNGSIFEWNQANAFPFNASILYFPNAVSGVIPNFLVTKTAGLIPGTTATINGLLVVNSNFAFNPTSGTVTFRDGISGNSQLTLNSTGSGTYSVGSPNAIFGGTVTIVLNKPIGLATGVMIPLGASVTISGSSVNGINKGSGGVFLVNGIIDMGLTNLSNTSGNVTVNGTLKTSSSTGLYGTGTSAISGGTVIFNTGSTIEYNANGDQTQAASVPNYYNVTFSGSGTKTISTNIPSGTVYVTGSAIVDATSNNIGNGATPTNLTMDGGRLILGTTGSDFPLMAGTYNLTGGVIEFACNNSSGQTIRGKTAASDPILYYTIEVSGKYVTAGANDITLKTNGSFKVKNGGTFTITNNKTIKASPTDGTQTVTLENGGLFECGSNQGFNGYTEAFGAWSSIDASITKINLNAGSTVEYMHAGAQPLTNADALIYSNLSIAGSGNKTAPSGILTVQGNLTKSGTSTFLHNNGTVLLNGPAPQSFAGLIYNNLILTNNIKTTNGNSTIIDSIKINNGTTLSIRGTPDSITLHSDPVKTARIGQIGTGTINYNVSGKFVVERYIPARKAWRFLAIPTNSSQTIKEAWQEGATSISDNLKPTYGTIITSDLALWSTKGFDEFSAGGPSVKTYNSTTNAYDGIPSTNSTSFSSSAGGYFIFIRGDRTATAFASPVTNTTLRTSGQLYTGTQAGIIINNQFIPVNNPYASQIDLASLSTIPGYYAWDPNRGGNYGYGGFTTFSWNMVTGTFDTAPQNIGSYGSTNNFIGNGQAFLASTFGSPVTIQFTENAKTSSTLAISPFTPIKPPGQQLRSDLYVLNIDGSSYIADGVLNTYSDNDNNSIDERDAKKNNNPAENLSIERNDTLLAIERRQTLKMEDTIFLQVGKLSAKRDYRFVFTPNKINESGLRPYLEDNYLNTKTDLHLTDTTRVSFFTDGSTGSTAFNRFRIVFDVAEGILPVTFTNVKAYTKNWEIAVDWEVENETGIKYYEVEKSTDETHFTSLVEVTAKNTAQVCKYTWTDVQPTTGYNYFRVKSVDNSGVIRYSKVVKVLMSKLAQGIHVYPNPLVNNTIQLQFVNVPAGWYEMRLINELGQVIASKEIQRIGSSSGTELIPIKAYAPHGVYRLEIIKPDGDKTNTSIIY